MPPDRFTPLPRPLSAEGSARRVGVEIELGGLSEAEVAEICTETLGGQAEQGSGPFWTIRDSRIGTLEVYLDIFLRKATQTKLRDLALELGREVVPVEIVTEPLDMAGLEALEDLTGALRRAGALGSGAGWVFGFGVHLNVEIASSADEDVVRPLLAYALIEDWMRRDNPIDESRRLLPFTDPYPTDLVRGLIALGPEAALQDVMTLYLSLTPSRNHGLDMLPVFAHLAPETVARELSGPVSARPAFHFRLPDCLIDEEDWSIADEWRRWIIIERVAGDAAVLARLAEGWKDDHGIVTLSRDSWARRCGKILRKAGMAAA